MSQGAYDRRGCSFAADVDAAIERVVRDLEGRDVALRLDALRALSVHARLAFETARARERLGQHPVAMDLITGVTSPSPVYKTLAETLAVESCSCVYDGQRDVVMTTSVCWALKRSRARVKKRKQTAGTCPTDSTKKMYTNYRFERTRRRETDEESDGADGCAEWTLVKFSLVVAFGDDDPSPRELLYFELACEHPYPKSYYEDQHGSVLRSGGEGDEGEGGEGGEEEGRVVGDEESKTKKEEEEEEDEQVIQKSDLKAVDEAKGDDDETFGEEQRDFRFDNDVLADMAEWMRSSGEDDELDAVDVVGFFLALPVYEDEWLIDERVCAILFQDGTEGDGRDDSGSETKEENARGALELMRR